MEYYSGFEKKRKFQYTVTQVNLEDIMLSEVSQSLKDKYHMIPFIRGSQIHRAESITGSKMVVVRDCG